jgi:predicted site-specific integrase-resolvase
MSAITFPMSTAQVARLLGVAEFTLQNQIRAGRIHVPQMLGRRVWSALEVRQAATVLGKMTPALDTALAQPA